MAEQNQPPSQSGADSNQTTPRVGQPRQGRARQLRRMMERRTTPGGEVTDASGADTPETGAALRQPARARQMRSARQPALPREGAEAIKVQRARFMQLRQLAASKALSPILPQGAEAARPPIAKVARARAAQARQTATPQTSRNQAT
jgi:hypothetical protein